MKGILGICLGMQILFDSGDETIKEYHLSRKDYPSLREVVSPIHGSKNPEYGFKDISIENAIITDKIPGNKYYFMHAYSAKPADPTTITSYYMVNGISRVCKNGKYIWCTISS